MKEQYECEIKKLDNDLHEKLAQMEDDYEKALSEALEKYKTTRNQIEDKVTQEKQLKATIKQIAIENKEYEEMIQERQVALRRLKHEYENQIR